MNVLPVAVPVSLFVRSKHSKKLEDFVCAEVVFEDTKKLSRLGWGCAGEVVRVVSLRIVDAIQARRRRWDVEGQTRMETVVLWWKRFL